MVGMETAGRLQEGLASQGPLTAIRMLGVGTTECQEFGSCFLLSQCGDHEGDSSSPLHSPEN